MPEVRTLSCDRHECEEMQTEKEYGGGFMGWGSVGGVNKNGAGIFLCPKCLTDVLKFIDPMQEFE